jgi:transposase
MATLVDDLVPDQLWAIVEPLLPAPPRPPGLTAMLEAIAVALAGHAGAR